MGLAPRSRPPRPPCRERGCLRNQCVWSLDSPASLGKWTSCVGCRSQRAPVCDLIDLWVLGHPTVGGSLASLPPFVSGVRRRQFGLSSVRYLLAILRRTDLGCSKRMPTRKMDALARLPNTSVLDSELSLPALPTSPFAVRPSSKND